MKSGRFMDIDYREAGLRMVLDRATFSLIPKALVARMDSAACDVIVKKGEKLPGPGPRKCSVCGFEWVLKPGEPDICPSCKHPNVIPVTETAPPERIEIVWKHRDESPQETMKRSEKIIREAKGLPSVKLTVGDLSLAKEQKKDPRRVRQQLQAMDRGLSVGDLSHVTDANDSVEGELQRAKAERDGLSVGDLFQGRRCTPQPNMSERQELEAKRIQRHRKKVDERRRISELLSGRDEALEEYAEKHLKPKTA